MLKVKENYKNGYPDQTCRACKINNESQRHVLFECKTLNPDIPSPNDNEDQDKTTDMVTSDPLKNDNDLNETNSQNKIENKNKIDPKQTDLINVPTGQNIINDPQADTNISHQK